MNNESKISTTSRLSACCCVFRKSRDESKIYPVTFFLVCYRIIKHIRHFQRRAGLHYFHDFLMDFIWIFWLAQTKCTRTDDWIIMLRKNVCMCIYDVIYSYYNLPAEKRQQMCILVNYIHMSFCVEHQRTIHNSHPNMSTCPAAT